jgi:protein-tyrosine phosphatase
LTLLYIRAIIRKKEVNLKQILCVCFGNSCRSPMMKTLLIKKLSDKGIEVIVDSAGVAEKAPTPASENAKAAMKYIGLSVEDHVSKHVREVDLSSFDHILVVDQKTKDAIIEKGAPADKITILNEEKGGVPNPYGEDENVYHECASCIDMYLDDFIKEKLA